MQLENRAEEPPGSPGDRQPPEQGAHSRLADTAAALRPHQWLKNLLVFVPLVLAHKLHEPALVGQALLAFVAFGFCASCGYVINDLFDLSHDRMHPTKRQRPIAAGRVPVRHAVLLIPLLLAAAAGLSVWLPLQFAAALGIYFSITTAYSLRLKSWAPVDVLVLAGLYTLRLIAGAAAVAVPVSFWLLAFSMFLFFSLALVKRYTELSSWKADGIRLAAGRGYRVEDLELLGQLGVASALASVLVLALYINSDAVRALYSRPELIWLLCPLLLYLVSRIWLLARRNQLDQDPVVFAMRDRTTYGVAVASLFLLWMAT